MSPCCRAELGRDALPALPGAQQPLVATVAAVLPPLVAAVLPLVQAPVTPGAPEGPVTVLPPAQAPEAAQGKRAQCPSQWG